ncbi:MAG: hypothetical protein IPF54_05280 [Draconibacterium sp.]|nr:hypothetical protein [Draconibacterium sp.]
MLNLKTEDGKYIPILFRPFHEHTGSWFWWGKDLCSVEEYKVLWRFTVSYLQNEKNIHHLIYTYSTDRFKTAGEYLERYPGDDIIDVLGFDLYDRGTDYPGFEKIVLKRLRIWQKKRGNCKNQRIWELNCKKHDLVEHGFGNHSPLSVFLLFGLEKSMATSKSRSFCAL